jgi:hypothetical protein
MRCSRIKLHNYGSVVDEEHTNDHVRSFLGFLHNNMVDSPTNIVLLGSNRNRVGSTSGGKSDWDGCVDWGIDWHNVPCLRSGRTYDQLAAGLGQLGSFEHSDS